ncbi:hypothetical protein PUN28_015782 [Cardiocondyla obscurior]|uniref:Pre-C2HC domain-containing protein n=1 Tax=Cardiocondyla obscurior TaxID=286306 RepID=A0AAW2EYE7_9HYME
MEYNKDEPRTRSLSFSGAHLGIGLSCTTSKPDYNQMLAEIQRLQQEVTMLNQENAKLKAWFTKLSESNGNLNSPPINLSTIPTDKVEKNLEKKNNLNPSEEYITDEEELERETDWILKKNRNKKRKNEFTTPPDIQHKKTNILQPDKPKERVPPPFYIDNMAGRSLKTVIQKIEQINLNEDKFTTQTLASGGIKVNVYTDILYRAVTKMLLEEKFSFHTYENKNYKPIRVMIRHLHPTLDPEDIIAELREKHQLPAEKAVNIISRKDKNVSLIYGDIQERSRHKKIFQLKFLLHQKIKVEALRKNFIIPQCKKCQGFGHTQNHCYKEAFCVKCAGKHYTSQCNKPKDADPKCVNCGGKHPASYRGCEIAKELQSRREKKVNQKSTKSAIRQTPIETTSAKTFAQVVETRNKEEEENVNKITNDPLIKTLNQILDRIGKLEERFSILEKKVTEKNSAEATSKQAKTKTKKR